MATDIDSVYFGAGEALASSPENQRLDHQCLVRIRSGGRLGAECLQRGQGSRFELHALLALEYGSRGVRVNAVAPSLTSTDATAELMKSDALMAAFRERMPIGRSRHTR
jgi:meso-butanediol dehydrogenase/(S,S)-butanediol dehydrogenase/diacetyl reductase